MPNENKITYKVGTEIYDIPISEKDGFLSEFKDAVEVKSFTVDKDTFDIPVNEVNQFLKDVPNAKPLSFDTGQPADLGKPVTAPKPGVGGGLPSDGTPGKEVGISQLDIPADLFQKIGLQEVSPVAAEVEVPENKYEVSYYLKKDKTGKQTVHIIPEKGYEIEQSFAGLSQKERDARLAAIEEEASQSEIKIELPASQKEDVNALYKQPDLQKNNITQFKYTGEVVNDPYPNLQKRLKAIEKYGDEDVKKMEQAKVFDDFIIYGKAELKNFAAEAEIINKDLEQKLGEINNSVAVLEDPNVPQEQKQQIISSVQMMQQDFVNKQKRLQNIEYAYNKNLNELNDLTSARKAIKFNYNSALEIGAMALWDATLPSLMKGIGSLYEFQHGLAKELVPKEYEKTFDRYDPLNKLALFFNQGGEAISANIDPNINTDLQKNLLDETNSRNVAMFFGNLIGSVATTYFTGGYGAAMQAFGSSYQFGKDMGLNSNQAGFFALPIAIVAGYAAPYGTEKFAKILTNPASKEALKVAINTMKSNPNAAFNKILEISKGVFKGTLEEAAEEGVEQLTEEASKKVTSEITGISLYGEGEKDDILSIAERSGEAAFMGGMGSLVLNTLIGVAGGHRYGDLSNIVSKSLTDPKKETEFLNDIDSYYQEGRVSDEQYQEIQNLFNRAKQAVNQIPPNVKNENAIARSVQLIMSQNDIEEQLKKVNPSMSGELKAQLNDINRELARIAKGEIPKPITQSDEVVEGKIKSKDAQAAVIQTEPSAIEAKPAEVSAEVTPTEPTPTEAAPVAEVTVAEPLKDVESTAKALDAALREGGKIDEDGYQYLNEQKWSSIRNTFTPEMDKEFQRVVLGKDQETVEEFISEAYHADKAAGKETELTKAVEELLAKPSESAVAPEAAPTEAAAQPTLEDFDIINMTSVKGRKAREELKARVGVDAYKKMDMVNKKFEETINDLEKKGILRKECP